MFERLEDGHHGLSIVRGTTPDGGRFTVHEQGAHITEWTPAGEEPVLFTSAYARFEPRVAIRGGIPICFPWFANGRKDNKSPAHGFARLAIWQLLEGRENDGVTTLQWRLDQTMIPRVDGIDPDRNRFELTCTQTFGTDLRASLRIHNTDDLPLVVEEALHTYLRVGDVRRAAVLGLAGTEILSRRTGDWDTQIGPVTFAEEVDQIHWVSGGVTEIHDPVLGRRIVQTTSNSANAVVWNPWAENAAELKDLGDDEWTEFVCVETANVRNKAIHLNPGQAHELDLTIVVVPL